MLITDKEKLEKLYTPHRVWQGVAAIAHTTGGKTFVAFYSGNTKEAFGNYIVLIKSDDGVNFGEPCCAVVKEGKFRTFDPVLWLDPASRLWFIWNVMPGEEVWGAICENPDKELKFGEPFKIGRGVMMNKPTVTNKGEWLFPIAFWTFDKAHVLRSSGIEENDIPASYVYKSTDEGKTFKKIGGSQIKNRDYDEHMILENDDSSLSMFVRTKNGIGRSDSFDGGYTWSEGCDTGWGGPNSRFFISRLNSGRVLLINHDNSEARTGLTLYLSSDGGKTFPDKLTLDERRCSYPDAMQADDGFIYVVYDRERGGNCKSLEEVYKSAREILVARVTEEDIIAGKLISDTSRLKVVASKLTKLADSDPDPYIIQ